MANDPHWNSVVLALRMDDTGLTDLKGHTVTKTGGVSQSSTQSKFGGYSAYFDGTSGVLSLSDSSDLELGAGDFTIEAFVYRPSGTGGTIASKVGTFSTAQYSFVFTTSAAGALIAYVSTTGTSTAASFFSSDGVVPAGEWHHVAFVRSGTTLRLCVDGISVASKTLSGAIYDGTALLKIGAHNATSAGFFTGYIDEFRITKGVARYPGATPSESLPSTPPQLSGTVVDLAGNPVARTLRSHRVSDGIVGGSTTSASGDGAFSLDAYDASAHYVVCFDDDLNENALILDNITPV